MKRCGDCVFFSKYTFACEFYPMAHVKEHAPACHHYTNPTGDGEFKPMFTVQITPKEESKPMNDRDLTPIGEEVAKTKAPQIDEQVQRVAELYISDMTVRDITKTLKIGAHQFYRLLDEAEKAGLIKKRRGRGAQNKQRVTRSETERQEKPSTSETQPTMIDVTALSDDELRELAARIYQEAGARFLRAHV